MSEKIVFEIEFDDADADKKLKDLVKSAIELKAEKQALDKAFKEGAISMQDYADKTVKNTKDLQANAKATADLKKDMELATAGRKAATGSIEQERIRLAQLTKAYNALSKEQRENYEEGKKIKGEIKGISDALKGQESAIGDNRRSVGNYTESIKEAIVGNTSLGKSISTVGAAVKTNPIGFLVTALISLLGVLKESKPFMDFFEGVMSRINAVVDVAKDRFFTFASGLKEIFSGNFAKGAEILSSSIKGIGDEIAREVKLSGELSAARQQLERDQINNIATSKAMIAEEEKLKNIRDNEFLSIGERIQANEAAAKIEQERLDIQAKLAERNISLLQQEIDRRGGLSKVSNDQLKQLREAELELADIREEAAGRENEFLTNRFQLQQEANEKAVAMAKERAERQAAEEAKALQGSISALEKHESKLLELQTSLQDKLTKAAAKGVEDRKKWDEVYLQEQQRIADEEIRIQQAKVGAIYEISGALTDIAGAFVENAKTAAGIQKGLALFQIGIDTAQAISSLTRNSEGNPANALTGGIAGVIQFATGLARILANIAKAKQLLSAKPAFADGGLVRGPGGPKDDRIPALLSNGESVLTARATAMFGPQLSAMNVAGGGKPFKFADGGLVARTVSAPVMASQQVNQMYKMIASMPAPVVTVTDLNTKLSQVAKTVAVSDH